MHVIDIGRTFPAGGGDGVTRRRRRTANLTRLCAAGLLALGLAGCVTQAPRTTTIRHEVAPTDSFARMWPGGPATVSVIEKRYKDAIVRETVLATNSRVSGSNFITVTLYGQSDFVTEDDNALGRDSIEPWQIAREFQWYLLGVPMKTSNLYAQNKYGPFGFATGVSRTGDRCIYGWQLLSRSRFLENGAIGIRLRICDRISTEQELLAMMYRFDIVGYLPSKFWNPYGKPPAVSGNLGAMSSPVVPAITTTAPAPVRSGPRRQVVAPQPIRPIQGPIVPLPGGYGAGEEIPVVPLPN